MKDKKTIRFMRSNKMILFGIALCILIWIVESAIHVFVFPRGNFIENLFTPTPHEFWMRLLIICSLVIFSIHAQFTITKCERAEEKLIKYQKQLRSLVSELSLTEEQERRRLATDLHDSISQVLAISKLKVETLRDAASYAGLKAGLEEIHELIKQAIGQTRSLTFELSPPVLYQFGLEAAVESLVERMQEMHGIRIDFTDDKQPKPLSEEVRVLLFRAVKELLVNIVKHAQVRSARISLEREDGYARIVVADEGVGFPVSDTDLRVGRAGGFGLFSIKERLQHLGGFIEIASKSSQGTKVQLMAPLQGKGKTPKEKVA